MTLRLRTAYSANLNEKRSGAQNFCVVAAKKIFALKIRGANFGGVSSAGG